MRLYLLLHLLVLTFIKASVCCATSMSQSHILELYVLIYWRWERMIAVLIKFSQRVGKPILTSDFQFCLFIQYLYSIYTGVPMTLHSTPSFCIFLFFFQTTSLSFLLFMETNWPQVQFQSRNKYSNGSHSSEKSPRRNNKNGLLGQKWSSP